VISSLVSRFYLMLIDIAAGFLLARCFSFTFDLGSTIKQAVCSSLLLIELPLDSFARLSKIDDVTHLVPFVLAGWSTSIPHSASFRAK
jgi:hypothetical protein